VRLAMEKLILPELVHIVREATKVVPAPAPDRSQGA
jgi:hypothetical protein